MKKYEFIGLALAVSIVIITYMFNYFYNEVNYVIQPRYVAAENYKSGQSTNIVSRNLAVFTPLVCATSKENYYRHELVDIYADYKDINNETITNGELEAKVYKGNKLIPSVAGMERIFLKYNSRLNLWAGKWPVPYNPDMGRYNVLVRALPSHPGPVITAVAGFNIIGRIPLKTDRGLCAMLLEYGGVISDRRSGILGPDDTEGDWRNIIKWANYSGANAFFMLGAETQTYNPYVNQEHPFDRSKLRDVKTVARETKKNNLQFGAWTMTFGFQGKDCAKVGYKPSMTYDQKTGRLYPSYMHISLIDEKRFNDLVNVVREFDKNPDIDYIGFDYVRTGHKDGYEMADLVVRDMSIAVPGNWDSLSEEQKAVWFAKKIIVDRDSETVEKWEWWRAHKVAEIINKVITVSGTVKPVWTFTLGWEHGKQHGQDPLMMMDAGVAIDAVMLYEANQHQFRTVLVDWKGYVSSSQVNLIVGQTVDVKLNDSYTLIPPEEFINRITQGTKKMVFGGLTDGLFWHDASRALWGRKGPYTTKEWFLTAGKAFSAYKSERGESGVKLNMSVRNKDYNTKEFYVDAVLENQTINPIDSIRVNLIETEGVAAVGERAAAVKNLTPGEKRIVTFQVKVSQVTSKFKPKYMVAMAAELPNEQRVFDFEYIAPTRVYTSVEPESNKVSPK